MSAEAPARPAGLHPDLPDAPRWPGLAVAVTQCVRFHSRLPVPDVLARGTMHAVPDFRIIPRALPIAALIIACPAAATLWLCIAIGLDSLLAAALAVAVLVATTGAFHEDGLADAADGLFGGQNETRRLEIMKDSRVGSFGATALILALILRISALSAIAGAAGSTLAAMALLGAAIWSRCLGLKVLADHPPARANGAAATVGRPTRGTMIWALGLGLALTQVLFSATRLPSYIPWPGLALALIATHLFALLARRLIGGQTGDIAGAAQQLAEICFYLAVAVMLALARAS